MLTTVLLDLDDTLLVNDMDVFIPVYLKEFGKFVADLIPPDVFVEEILQGTQRMFANDAPDKTLESAFAEYFYPALGYSVEELTPRFERFYQEVFPKLSELTAPRPEAPAVVRELLDRDLEVVIATNPLFPWTAVEQRLEWAGISPEYFSYNQVTTYENYHFTKPNPAYYAEILARVGHNLGDALMVGNDPANDLIPARMLGIRVYHVHDESESEFPGGDLQGLLTWIDHLDPAPQVQETDLTPVVTACLRGHLAALCSMMEEVSPQRWKRRPSEENWAPIEIVAHLRDVDREVSLPRILTVLAEENPLIQAVDPDSWVSTRNYIGDDIDTILNSLIASRKDLINSVANLKAEDWSRPAIHALLGPTTLAEIAKIMTEHDLIHLNQLRTTLELL